MKDIDTLKSDYTIEALVEALLFCVAYPVTIHELSRLLNVNNSTVENALKNLCVNSNMNKCITIQRNGNKVQLVTIPEISSLVEDFLGVETTTTLSQAALEALAIIAYRQPVSRPEIEEVRGVNSDGVVRTLLTRGLIEECGRSEGLGRAILYQTTSDFLSQFGIMSLEDLPSFDVLPNYGKRENQILKD
jgi:segregation and condensation protein B